MLLHRIDTDPITNPYLFRLTDAIVGVIFEKGELFLKFILFPLVVMLKKKLFEELGGFDETLPACEDYDLWLRIALLLV